MHTRTTLKTYQQSTPGVSPCQEEEQLRQLSEVASTTWRIGRYGNSEFPPKCPNLALLGIFMDIRWYWDILGYTVRICPPNPSSLGVILSGALRATTPRIPSKLPGKVPNQYMLQCSDASSFESTGADARTALWVKHMGVSINGGTRKWMVYNGKSH